MSSDQEHDINEEKLGIAFKSHIPEAPVETMAWTNTAKLYFGSLLTSAIAAIAILIALLVQIKDQMAFDSHGSYTNSTFYPSLVVQILTIFANIIMVGGALMAIKKQSIVYLSAVTLFHGYLVLAGYLDAGQRSALDQVSTKNLYALNSTFWCMPAIQNFFWLVTIGINYKIFSSKSWTPSYRKLTADPYLCSIGRSRQLLTVVANYTTVFTVMEAWEILTVSAVWLDITGSKNSSLMVANYTLIGFLILFNFALQVVLAWAVPREIMTVILGILPIQVVLIAFQIATIVISTNRLLAFYNVMLSIHKMYGVASFIGALKSLGNQNKLYLLMTVTTSLQIIYLMYTFYAYRGFGKGLKVPANRNLSKA